MREKEEEKKEENSKAGPVRDHHGTSHEICQRVGPILESRTK